MKNFRNRIVEISLLAAPVGAALLSSSNAASNPGVPSSGSICVEETQYNPFHWDEKLKKVVPGPELPPFTGAKAACTNFHQNLGSTKRFDWYTYAGEIHALEKAWTWVTSASGTNVPSWEPVIDNTDITVLVGHGSSSTATDGHRFLSYYIWDYVPSKQLYLGNPVTGVGPGLSVLSIYSCYTLTPYAVAEGGHMPFAPNDPFEVGVAEGIGPRWLPAMKGGLRMVTGTWNQQLTGGAATTVQNYGTYLKTNTVSEAWRHAAFDGGGSNAPAVLARDADAPSCNARISQMTLYNLSNYARLRDQNVPGCWVAWW